MSKGKELKAVLSLAGQMDPSLKRAMRQAAKDAVNLGKKGKDIGAGFSSGASIAKTAFAGMGKAGIAAAKAVSVAVVAAGTAVAGLGVAAVKTGIEYESAFTGVLKTVDFEGSAISAEQMSDKIREMALVMPPTATEIAGVAEVAGQLGVETDSIVGFTKTMIKMGDATNLAANDAATSLARMANVTGMEQTVENFERMGSTIVSLGNTSATSEAEIVAMAQNMASAGSQVGMSDADIMGVAAAWSSLGLESQAGGSSFSKIVSQMALDVETGGGNLANFASVAGVSVSEFQEMFSKDAVEALSAFTTGLRNTEDMGQSTIAMLDEMGITELRMSDALRRTANSENLMKDAVATANEAWESNTALTKEAELRYGTMESQLGMLKNGVKDLGIEIYQSIDSPMMDVVATAKDMVAQLKDSFKSGGLKGMVASVGDIAADIVKKVAKSAPTFIKTGANVVRSFLDGINKNREEIGDAAAQTVSSFAEEVVSLAPELLNTGFNMITDLVGGIAKNGESIAASAMEAVASFADNIAANGPTLIKSAATLIKNFAGGLLDNLPKLLDSGINMGVSLVAGLADAIPTLVDVALDMGFVINDTLSNVNWLAVGYDIVKYIGAGLLDGIFMLSGKIIEPFADLFGLDFEIAELGMVDMFRDMDARSAAAGEAAGKSYQKGMGSMKDLPGGGTRGEAFDISSQRSEAEKNAQMIADKYQPASAAADDFSESANESMTDYSAAMMVANMDTAAFSAQVQTDMQEVQLSVTESMTQVQSATQDAFSVMTLLASEFVSMLRESVVAMQELAVAGAGMSGGEVKPGAPPRLGMAFGGILRATQGGIPVTAAEAGHDEAFIPITRTPRSIGLLTQTAARLGINLSGGAQTSANIVYAPKITVMGNATKNDIAAALATDREAFNNMLDEYFAEKGRTSFGSEPAPAY